MKIRTSFVANSSSSSFLVAIPENADYNFFVEYINPYLENLTLQDFDDLGNISKKVIDRVYDDYVKSNNIIKVGYWPKEKDIKLKVEDTEEFRSYIHDIMNSGSIEGCISYFDLIGEGIYLMRNNKDKEVLIEKAQEQAEEHNNKLFNKIIDFFIEKSKEMYGDKDVYVVMFEYCDNEGPFESMLEHGQTFRNLPNICISNH